MRFMAALVMVLINAVPALGESSPQEQTKLLSQKLRCPVCNGQSLWESQNPTALDIQKVIFEKFSHGQSEKEIVDYLYVRYGNDILQTPSFGPETYFLWLFPVLLVIGLGVGVYVFVRRRESSLS